jgi:hypothetical protein
METWDLRELEGLADAADALARGFDPGALAATDATLVVELTTRLERAANGMRLRAMGIVSETGSWRFKGHTTDTDWYARTTGKPLGEAMGDVKAGKALGDLPKVADAVRTGRLSPAEARAIAETASVAPEAQDELLRSAGKGMKTVQEACKRAKAAADPDPEATRRRIDASRSATQHSEADGTAVLTLKGTADRIGRMWAHAEHRAKEQFDRARVEGRHEPWAAYVFDAVEQQLLDSGGGKPMPSGANAKIIFGIDLTAYRRGHAQPGERCELIGVGPVPVSVVREAADDAFIAAVVTEGKDIRLVAHPKRRPTVLQETALQWRSPTCVVEGCERTARLQIDHDLDWSLTEITTLDYLEQRCHEHHAIKTREGWTTPPRDQAVDPEQRPLVPPSSDDPPPAVRRGRTRVDPDLIQGIHDHLEGIEHGRRRAEPA